MCNSLIDIAKKYIGTKEQGGDNRGPLVEMFQKAVNGKAERESWCMCFVQYCILQLEIQNNVKSKVFKSEHCLTVWNKSPKELRLKEPQVGCLIIWQFANSISGHVGIVTKVNKATVETIEGNTSGSSVSVVREGDEVAAKVRSKTGSKAMKVIGYLKVL